MSGKTSFVRSQLNLIRPIAQRCSLGVVRHWQDKLGGLMSSPYKDSVKVERLKIGKMNCSLIVPREELCSGIVLYLHGGGYVAGNLGYACGFGSMLSAKCGVKVLAIEYRLAPEHVFPAALDDAMDAYGYLLSNGYEPSKIILCGDSAGGGMCYSLCQKLRDKGRTLPGGIIAISPWTDLTHSSESYVLNKRKDPSMTVDILKYFADCYVYGATGEKSKMIPRTNPDEESDARIKSDPRISPLFDSQEKMPESLIFVGGDEIMHDDAAYLHEKLLSAGVKSELVVAPDLWHGYVLYDLPERSCDFVKISKFIKRIIPAHKKLAWMTLDNAAKIFPASRSRTWINIFRVSATLDEEIDKNVLKSALDVVVRRFPSIAVCIKEGFFWYYLEEISCVPDILDEKPYPLARMSMRDLRKCAFRVLVYKKRLAVEFFHSLTDGNGGLIFVKTLVSEYLYQKYGVKVPVGDGIFDRLKEPSPEEIEDSFLKYSGKHAASRKDTDAYIISGKRDEDGYRTNTTFVIDASRVVSEAKSRGVTVSAYMSAVLIEAARRVQANRVKNPKKYKPIKLCLPVNLRKIFPSKTMRNFILYATPGIDPRLGDYTFDEICSIVAAQMKLQITEKNMAAMIKTNVDSEKSQMLRIVPLFIKNIVMKQIFNAVGEKKTCFSFSNLGVVNAPEEFSSRVDRMDFVIGCQAAAPYNVSSLTYKGKMYLNVIRNMRDAELEREIYTVLKEQGIPHTVESNSRGRE